MTVQSSLVRDNIELAIENGRRLAELSAGVAENGAGPMNEQRLVKGIERRRRAA
jgi:hypothetical protein